jgi:xylulokinase
MIIAHDLGTTGDKATLVDGDGRVRATATVAYATDFGPSGKAEQDPLAWWSAFCQANRMLLEQYPESRAALTGISFSGQMMGAVLLDRAGVPVRPAIIWADTRASAQAARLNDEVGAEEGYRITGHRFNATYSLPKVMWVRDHEPDVFAGLQHVVLAKDYLVYRLTGEICTDPSDASGTNLFDQPAHRWSDEIAAAAGLPTSMFPQVVPSTAVPGVVGKEASMQCGLPAGLPVVIGGGDGPMAALGAGIIDSQSGAYTYLGSSSWVSYAADAPLHDPAMRTMTFNHVLPDRFVPTATMQAGGASVQWITELLTSDDVQPYERLLESAGTAAAAADGLFYLPYLLGERSPYWNPLARGVFAGLARHHGRPNLARAVLEGVAFNLYAGIEAFTQNGASLDRVDAIGGMAKSAVALGIFADVWGLPVQRLSLVDEATSLGAAVVGGVATGMFSSFDVAVRSASRSTAYEPDKHRHTDYKRAFTRFTELYRRLEPWFEEAAT